MMTFRDYTVTPLTKATKHVYEDKLVINEILYNRIKKISFWDFLQLNFLEQLDYLSLNYLIERKNISFSREPLKASVEFEEYVIDRDYLRKICDLVYNYREGRHKIPKYVFIGVKQYQELKHEVLINFPEFVDKLDSRIAGIIGTTKLVISPYLKGVFVWDGEE